MHLLLLRVSTKAKASNWWNGTPAWAALRVLWPWRRFFIHEKWLKVAYLLCETNVELKLGLKQELVIVWFMSIEVLVSPTGAKRCIFTVKLFLLTISYWASCRFACQWFWEHRYAPRVLRSLTTEIQVITYNFWEHYLEYWEWLPKFASRSDLEEIRLEGLESPASLELGRLLSSFSPKPDVERLVLFCLRFFFACSAFDYEIV